MTLSRPHRFIAALIALIGMLFMQLAVAGYVCSDLSTMQQVSEQTIASAQIDHHGMVDCGAVDMEQPALCHAHADVGNQSLDKPQSPPVPQFVAAALTLVVRDIEPLHDPAAAQSLPVLTRSTEPALAIQHCCFRI